MHILIAILCWLLIAAVVYLIGLAVLFTLMLFTDDSEVVSEVFKYGYYWPAILVATPPILLVAGIVEGISFIGRKIASAYSSIKYGIVDLCERYL